MGLFKKKVKAQDKMALAVEIKNSMDNLERMIQFMRSEGVYKIRREVKLTDKEYSDRVGMIASDILMTYMKAIVAERIIVGNGLFKVYSEQLKEVGQAMGGGQLPVKQETAKQEPENKEPPADGPSGEKGGQEK